MQCFSNEGERTESSNCFVEDANTCDEQFTILDPSKHLILNSCGCNYEEAYVCMDGCMNVYTPIPLPLELYVRPQWVESHLSSMGTSIVFLSQKEKEMEEDLARM